MKNTKEITTAKKKKEMLEFFLFIKLFHGIYYFIFQVFSYF